ncbi:MAG TPA: DMT family transporter [Candidatus Limnocylindrales bacterium]
MDRRRLVGVLLVVVSAASFGSGALFAKPVYAEGVGWLTLLCWRFAVAAGLSWAWLLVDRGRRTGLRRTNRRRLAVALVLGIVYLGNSSTYYAALETVSASLAALIVYIYPAIVAVLTLRLGRPLEGRRAWLALGLALLGVILAIGGIPTGTAPPLVGLLQVLASPVIYSIWIVAQARLAGERSDRVGDASDDGAGSATAAALMMTSTAIGFWLIALASGTPVAPGQIPAGAWPGMIAVAVISTFVAIQTFSAGSRLIGAAQASLISTVEPVWTICLAALILGERLGPIQLVGGVLVIGGVILAQLRTGEPAPDAGGLATVRIADE